MSASPAAGFPGLPYNPIGEARELSPAVPVRASTVPGQAVLTGRILTSLASRHLQVTHCVHAPRTGASILKEHSVSESSGRVSARAGRVSSSLPFHRAKPPETPKDAQGWGAES